MNYRDKVKYLLTGMTQEALAVEVQTSQPTISRIVNGDVYDIRLNTAAKIDYLYELMKDIENDHNEGTGKAVDSSSETRGDDGRNESDQERDRHLQSVK